MQINDTYWDKLTNFEVKIDGRVVPVDRIRQLNLSWGVGVLGNPGDITFDIQTLHMIAENNSPSTSQDWNPVGREIQIKLEDPKFRNSKSDTRLFEYQGIITTWNQTQTPKQEIVTLGFDLKDFIKLNAVVWTKAFKQKTIVQIFKEFLTAHGVKMSKYPADLNRGTMWECFACPRTTPTAGFLVTELKKDNLEVFVNPEDNSVSVYSWEDINKLSEINKNNPHFVADNILANFDSLTDEWKKLTFIKGRQIDYRSPLAISNSEFFYSSHILENSTYDCTYYHAAKSAGSFENKVPKLEIPKYSSENLSTKEYPKAKTDGFEEKITHRIFPRNMKYRMEKSYLDGVKWVKSNIRIPGSIGCVCPFTAIMLSVFANRSPNTINKTELDPRLSGMYIITASRLSVFKNRMSLVLYIQKPYV